MVHTNANYHGGVRSRSTSSMIVLLIATLQLITIANATKATVSNIAVPVDTNGDKIITGEASILHYAGASASDVNQKGYYLYFNNWGTCPGVNCCDAAAGCATCCFNEPPHPYLPGCGNPLNGSDPYGVYHTFHVYFTKDFNTFTNLGVALSLSARLPGTAFRPQVIYNPKNNNFLMWYEDRGLNLHGYAVAESSSPAGPFITKYYNVTMPGKGRTGDFSLFADDDGKVYHIRTGFDIVQLNDDFTGPATHISTFTTPKASEGPSMFKRNGKYFALAGTGCCACIGGSTMYVLQADNLTGPWKYLGDVGSNPTPFDPHSPNNFVTKAQGSAVVHIPGMSTSDEGLILWLGNQWNSGLSETPPGPRNHDLLYWTVLNFNASDAIEQVVYQESVTFDIYP